MKTSNLVALRSTLFASLAFFNLQKIVLSVEVETGSRLKHGQHEQHKEQQQQQQQASTLLSSFDSLRGSRKDQEHFRPNPFTPSDPVDNDNRFLVKFKHHYQFMAADKDRKLQNKSDPRSHNRSHSQVKIMSLPDDDVEVMILKTKEDVQYWEQRDDVEYVEPDHKVFKLGEYIPVGIHQVKALDISDDFVSNQKVCVIDSGYDITHPNLQSSREIVSGYTQVEPSLWTTDGNGHGTHVAGTIAAVGGDDQGVVGVMRNGQVKLHIVKIFADDGEWTWTSDLIRAVENCAEAGATVVNMSLGGETYSQAGNDAMERIYNQGVLLVAAAGNSGTADNFYPASYPSVMSVAAVDSSNEKAIFSQFNDQVDIAGPGVAVWSTVPGGMYAKVSGTSMASPHVAGVAALVWSHFPTATAQQIRQVLQSTAQDLGLPGRDDMYGHGLVRADLAYKFLSGGGGNALEQFDFFPFMDSHGNDIGWSNGGGVDAYALECLVNSMCLGFNSNGWMKDTIKPLSSWNVWTNDPTKGFYLKKVDSSAPSASPSANVTESVVSASPSETPTSAGTADDGGLDDDEYY